MLRERAFRSIELLKFRLVSEGVFRLTWFSGTSSIRSVSAALVILLSPAVLNMTRMLSLVEVITLPRWKWLHSSRNAITSDCC